MRGGHTEIKIVFDDLKDVIDIQKTGLRLFNYCASSFEMLTSTFSTALLFVGGGGSSNYLPVLGSKPTQY
jgi:hypothetical protein